MARNTKYMIAVHERFKTLSTPLIFSSSIEGSVFRIFRVEPPQYVPEVRRNYGCITYKIRRNTSVCGGP